MGLGVWLKDRVGALVESQLGPDFHKRTQALAIRQNEYGYDPFGFTKASLKYAAVLGSFLYRNYFRCETHGLANVPAGRVLLVANHSGQLPFDAMVIGAAMFLEGEPPRVVRSMVEKFIPTLPFVSYLLTRTGQITGTPENCRRLLEDGEAILVFPEGVRGISKPFTQRYQLQDFGLGFMRLALENRTPIVPIAVIGAEEQAPAVNVKPLARLIGAPALPISPIPPFLPILPLPVKYRLYFGEPLSFDGDPDDDDDVIVDKVRVVKNSIQSMIHVGLKERKHVFW
ncbi:MAG TPA: lysophospholipid acyltransferase family protein [Haliangiales bacterium]|nr:lysophospholipid acyltransferase family protein [Haliangiales bacterium]